MSFLAEILDWRPIPEDKLVYFRERLRHRLHAAILDAFLKRSAERGLRQSDLAIRIDRTRAQITRWFSTASNLTLDSISDLMVGLGMDFDAFPSTPIEETITTASQRVSSEKADLGRNLRKALLTTQLYSWEQQSLSLGQSENLSETSATALAPSPGSGTMTSTVVDALQKHPFSNVIDFAARAQRRTDQLAQQASRQKGTFASHGVAA
jgi:hypothetical protein